MTPRMNALERENVRALTLDTAVQGIVQGGIAAFVSVFLVRLGAPNVVIGFLASAPALGAIFLSVPAGARLEGRTDLVRIVNVSRLFMRLAYVAIAAVPLLWPGPAAVWPIVILWTLTSVPAAIANPAWTAVVAEIVPARHRPRVNGNRWALLAVVTAASGAGFGWLLDRVPEPENFQVVFVVSFLAGLASIYFFGLIRVPGKSAESKAARLVVPSTRLTDLWRLVRDNPEFGRFSLTSFIYRIGLNLPVALYSIYWVRETQASNSIIGLQSTAANLALMASYLLWGRIAARSGHRIVLLLASAGTAFYPLGTALVRDPVYLIPVALIWGIFASGIDVSFFEALLRSIPADRRQTYIGLNSALANLVVFLAPIGGTLLANAVGLRPALFAAAGFSLFGSALFYALAVAREKPAVGSGVPVAGG